MTTTNTETRSTPDPYAGHTPGPLMAIEGDTLNPDRPWGVVRYLSREVCEELGDDPADYPSRTEVVAEICASSNPSQAEADARLFADASTILAERDALRAEARLLRAALRTFIKAEEVVRPRFKNIRKDFTELNHLAQARKAALKALGEI